jgi:hypothetical protein
LSGRRSGGGVAGSPSKTCSATLSARRAGPTSSAGGSPQGSLRQLPGGCQVRPASFRQSVPSGGA